MIEEKRLLRIGMKINFPETDASAHIIEAFTKPEWNCHGID